nr:MAG TPA: hypothetical protein [Caudoviricetes sp.]
MTNKSNKSLDTVHNKVYNKDKDKGRGKQK